MDDRVGRVLDAALPTHEVVDVGGTGPSWNERNETVRVETHSGDSFYVKYATDGDGTRIRREAGAIRYLEHGGSVPVPTIHATDPDATPPYLVTDRMSGQPLIAADAEADPETRHHYLHLVGRALASVHQHRFDQHAHILEGDETDLTLDPAPWSHVLADRIEFVREIGPSDRFDHCFDAVIDRVRANRELLDEAPATLVHGDPAKPNCVLNDGVIGLLDWELAHVGDPARELRRAHRQLLGGVEQSPPDGVVDALHDGYRAVAGDLPDGYEAREPIYAAVTFLGVCGFFDNYVEYREEPEADLAEWVETTMEERLVRIDEMRP